MLTVWYPVKVKIESMEEYSELKIYKSQPQLRSDVYAVYLVLFIGGNTQISHMVFVHDKLWIKQHASADICTTCSLYLEVAQVYCVELIKD